MCGCPPGQKRGAAHDQEGEHYQGPVRASVNLVQTYAAIINELSLENQALRDQPQPGSNVTPLQRRRGGPSAGRG